MTSRSLFNDLCRRQVLTGATIPAGTNTCIQIRRIGYICYFRNFCALLTQENHLCVYLSVMKCRFFHAYGFHTVKTCDGFLTQENHSAILCTKILRKKKYH